MSKRCTQVLEKPKALCTLVSMLYQLLWILITHWRTSWYPCKQMITPSARFPWGNLVKLRHLSFIASCDVSLLSLLQCPYSPLHPVLIRMDPLMARCIFHQLPMWCIEESQHQSELPGLSSEDWWGIWKHRSRLHSRLGQKVKCPLDPTLL